MIDLLGYAYARRSISGPYFEIECVKCGGRIPRCADGIEVYDQRRDAERFGKTHDDGMIRVECSSCGETLVETEHPGRDNETEREWNERSAPSAWRCRS